VIDYTTNKKIIYYTLYKNDKYDKAYFETLEKHVLIWIRYWTPCRPRLMILLLNGCCDAILHG